MEKKECPRCKGLLLMMYGYGWDYDRWVCGTYGCHYEEELTTTTYPKPEKEDNKIIKKISKNDEKLLEEVRKQQ